MKNLTAEEAETRRLEKEERLRLFMTAMVERGYQALVEDPDFCGDIGREPRQATFVEAPQHGILELGGLVFDRDMLVAKPSPCGDS
jgi:hypothetical protein